LTAIRLPFPAPALWPNKRPHWGAKLRATRTHRSAAFYATLEAKVPKPTGRVNVTLIIHPKTAHAIDADNAVSANKAHLDGIAQALGVNDSTFNSPVVRFAEPIKGGAVVIELAPDKQEGRQ